MAIDWASFSRTQIHSTLHEDRYQSWGSPPDELQARHQLGLLNGADYPALSFWRGGENEEEGDELLLLEGSSVAMTVVYRYADTAGVSHRWALGHGRATGAAARRSVPAGGAYRVEAPEDEFFDADEALDLVGEFLATSRPPRGAVLRQVTDDAALPRRIARTFGGVNSMFLTSWRRSYLEQLRHDLGRLDDTVSTFSLWAVPPRVRTRAGLAKKYSSVGDYLQSAGTAAAMVVEFRETHPDGSWDHWAIGCPGGSDPSAPDSAVGWGDGFEVLVRPHEVFDSEQAALVYLTYARTGRPPADATLRRIERLSSNSLG